MKARVTSRRSGAGARRSNWQLNARADRTILSQHSDALSSLYLISYLNSEALPHACDGISDSILLNTDRDAEKFKLLKRLSYLIFNASLISFMEFRFFKYRL